MKKIDALQMAFDDCCIRKASAEQHIERLQGKIDKLEKEVEYWKSSFKECESAWDDR